MAVSVFVPNERTTIPAKLAKLPNTNAFTGLKNNQYINITIKYPKSIKSSQT